jgi:DNA repair protein RecO (recombination protein O)
MAIHKTEALVIKTFDFRETSLVAHFYTKDFGKINGLLKGIRGEPEKFASTLEPFSHNEIIFYKKRNTSLHLVTQCDLRDNFTSLRGYLEKIALASLMMELVDAVMPVEDPNEDIFNLTLESLKGMVSYPYADKIATIFKIKLLGLSGFKPHFDSCISCFAKVTGQARFSINLGGLLCHLCFKKDIKARPIYRGTTATVLHIEKNNLENNLRLGINPQIKRELDFILQAFIGFHLEKELKSHRILKDLTERLRFKDHKKEGLKT